MTDHDLIHLSAEEAETICGAMHIGGDMRRVLILGCVEEKTLPEIAELMGRDVAYVAGLLEDAQLLATEYGTAKQQPYRDLLDAHRNTVNTNPHTPHYAINEYTGELQKTQLRSPLVNEKEVQFGDDWRSVPADTFGRTNGYAGVKKGRKSGGQKA